MTRMKESPVEKHFVKQVKAHLGATARKFKTRIGDPDRIVLLPDAEVLFVELKRPDEKPEPAQEREHARLRKLGFKVYVLDSKPAVDEWIAEQVKRLTVSGKDKCPECGKGMLLFSSNKVKICSDCNVTYQWPLDEGQKPLVCCQR